MNNRPHDVHNGEKRQTEETTIEKLAVKAVEYVASGDFERHATIAATAAFMMAPYVPLIRGLAASGNPATVPDTIPDAVVGTARKLHDVIGHWRNIGPAGVGGKGGAAGQRVWISPHKRGG
jgi:hypothetical protein